MLGFCLYCCIFALDFGWLLPVNWESPAPEALLLLISKTYLLSLLYS